MENAQAVTGQTFVIMDNGDQVIYEDTVRTRGDKARLAARPVKAITNYPVEAVQPVRQISLPSAPESWEPRDVLVVPQGTSAARFAYLAALPDAGTGGFAGVIQSSRMVGPVVGLPFALHGLQADVRQAVKSQGLERIQYASSAFATVGGLADATASFATGLRYAADGTSLGTKLASSLAIWAAPLTLAGVGVLAVFTTIAKSIGLYRTHKTMREMDSTLKDVDLAVDSLLNALSATETDEQVVQVLRQIRRRSRQLLGDHFHDGNVDEFRQQLSGMIADIQSGYLVKSQVVEMLERSRLKRRTLRVLEDLSDKKDQFLGVNFMTRKVSEVRFELARSRAKIMMDEDGAIERGQRLIEELKSRAKRKMKFDKLAIVAAAVSVVATLILVFTALTPVGWALMGLLALTSLAVFITNWKYRRQSLEITQETNAVPGYIRS